MRTQSSGNTGILAHQLLRSLSDDSRDLTTLLELLTQERKILEQNKPELLDEINQQKNQLTQTLEQRNNARVTQLQQSGYTPTENSWKPVIANLEQASGVALKSTWEKVEQQLKQCSELTAINEKIIANMRQNVNQLMNALRGEIGAGETYSADGKSTSIASNKPFASA